MECSQKATVQMTVNHELPYKIEPPSEEVRNAVRHNWDLVAKPLDGMGRFEELTAQIGAITGSAHLDIKKKAVIIMCADNGIVEEGVSQSGQEVTAAVAQEMAEKKSSVGKMASSIGVDTIPVDIGINQEEPIEGVLDRKIRRGTRNFHRTKALTRKEVTAAMQVGIELVADCKKAGYQLLATGEMGIGNTTTSSAVTAALLGCEPSLVTGRGAGLTDAGLQRKTALIAEAIETYQLQNADALTVLSAVGGLDIAGLVGVCIGGALHHVPIVLDGVISLTAALAAERLAPGTKAYLLPSHMGKEPAAAMLCAALDLEPVLFANLALGEGTGAVMLFTLLDMSLQVYRNRTTFSDLNIAQYERYDKK